MATPQLEEQKYGQSDGQIDSQTDTQVLSRAHLDIGGGEVALRPLHAPAKRLCVSEFDHHSLTINDTTLNIHSINHSLLLHPGPGPCKYPRKDAPSILPLSKDTPPNGSSPERPLRHTMNDTKKDNLFNFSPYPPAFSLHVDENPSINDRHHADNTVH